MVPELRPSHGAQGPSLLSTTFQGQLSVMPLKTPYLLAVGEPWATRKLPVDFQVPRALLGSLKPELEAGFLGLPLVSLSPGTAPFINNS